MMNMTAFKIYVLKMMEDGHALSFKDSNGGNLNTCNTDAHSIAIAVFKSKESTLTISDSGQVVGVVSLLTDYDCVRSCKVVMISNYNIHGQDVIAPDDQVEAIEKSKKEMSQTAFNAYAKKLLSEHDVVFEDYFSNQKKEYNAGVDDGLELTKDVFATDMIGIHISKSGEYLGHIGFVANHYEEAASSGHIFFDYAQVVDSSKNCEHLLPSTMA